MITKEYLTNLPSSPGVYMYHDKENNVLYVGKAKNLKERVGSYFSKEHSGNSKTKALMEAADSITHIQVGSETEALILEANLIKKHQPRFNIVLKDNKSFLYIEIISDPEELENSSYPVVRVSRKRELLSNSDFYGPFPSSRLVRMVLRDLRRIIPYRDCNERKFSRYKNLGRPCLYGDISICPAPCVEEISPSGYQEHIEALKAVLEGRSSTLTEKLAKEMIRASQERNYEEAKRYRDFLNGLSYIKEKKLPADAYESNPTLAQDVASQALDDLKNNLPILTTRPRRIECYDISDLSGDFCVGAMTVAIEGILDRSLYRKFKVKGIYQDDASRLEEILKRRLKRIASNDSTWAAPDLMVIDGGRPQISSSETAFEDTNSTHVPLVGIEKKQETLVYKKEDKFMNLRLSGENEGLKLLIRLRDEAHRFAQNYHHKLRTKDLLE